MLFSPLAMKPAPASRMKDNTDEQPNDLMAFLQKSLLGGQGGENLDPSMANLLTGLLGSHLTGGNNGQTY